MPRKLVLSEAAYYDIDSMFAYISQDNKDVAEKLRMRIYRAIKELADFPEKGAVLPEEDAPGAAHGYRRIVENPYIIIYRVLDCYSANFLTLKTRVFGQIILFLF